VKRTTWVVISTSVLALAACSDSGAEHPPAPKLGALMDRAGRPGVAPLLIAPFEPLAAHRAAVRAAMGSDDPSTWVADAAGAIAATLALYDGADGACGDQLLAAAEAGAGRYDALAAVLADDRLWVDTRQASCTSYLAVERGVAGDCGGRTPAMDVVDVTLSLLVSGTPAGVGDGVAADGDGPPLTTFPYLRAPAP